MRKLSLALALVVGLIGFSATANAGSVDIFYDTATGEISYRNDVPLIQIGINVEGGSAAGTNIIAGVLPGGVDPANTIFFDSGAGSVIIAAGPQPVAGVNIDPTGGAQGDPTNAIVFAQVAGLQTVNEDNVVAFLGQGTTAADGTAVTDVMFFELGAAPEPATLALLGLGIAGLAFVRRQSA